MKETINKPIFINISLATILKVIFAVFLVYLLFIIRDLLLVLLTSVIIASSIEPATKFFTNKRIPRPVGVLIIYAVVISILVATFSAFIPTLISDVQDITSSLPQYVVELSESNAFGNIPAIPDAIQSITDSFDSGDIFSVVGKGASGATVGFLATVSNIFGGLLSFALIIVLSFYMAVQENGVSNFIRLITPVKHEKYIIGLWKRSQKKIGLWMQGQMLLIVIVSVLTYLGLSIIGLENALLLAVIAGIFEIIPLFGPILASVPAIAYALLQGGPTMALIVGGIYLIIQQFESQLIHPLVVKKIVGIPAIVAIVALIIGAKVAGFLGVLISVPVAAAIMEYIGDVEKRKAKELEDLEA